MIEFGTSLEKFATAPLLYAGEFVMGLEGGRRMDIANLVSAKLTEHPNTMIQYSPGSIFKSMNEGRAACAFDTDGQLTAFAQYWPYEVDFTGDDLLSGLKIFEIGSWLRFATYSQINHGRKVFEACWDVGNMAHPYAGFVAIVEEGNVRASEILKSMGGQEIGIKDSTQVKDVRNNPAKMSIYRMLNPGR